MVTLDVISASILTILHCIQVGKLVLDRSHFPPLLLGRITAQSQGFSLVSPARDSVEQEGAPILDTPTPGSSPMLSH